VAETVPRVANGAAISVAVVGAGAFGRNHLRVYRALEATGNVRLTACVEPSEAARDMVAAEYGIPVFATVVELLASGVKIDAASVCTPTVAHAATAVALLGTGIDVLIEKPIASTLDEVDAILLAMAEHNCVVQVGHLERFNPAVTAAMPLRNHPMFFESHRLSVFTPRSLDVDVVLDLMIHDLDVVLTLAQSPVREVRAVGLPVLSDKTDIANVRVEFESGAVANFTASRVSTERVRKLRFFQPHQYLSLDFARQDLLLIDVTAAASLTPAQIEAVFEAQGMPNRDESHTAEEVETHLASLRGGAAAAEAEAAHPSAGLSLRKVPTEPGEPLRLEIESFLESVRYRTIPRVSGEDGRAALALALAINRAIAEHAMRAGI
jgi:predicted dehydrogenase